MKLEPYIMAATDEPNGKYMAAACASVSSASPVLKTDRNGDNFIVRGIAWNGCIASYLVGPNKEFCPIKDMNAGSPEEFWLKASAMGLIYGEDESKPLFKDAEKECARLKDKTAKLEKKLAKYKDMIKGLFSQSEKISD